MNVYRIPMWRSQGIATALLKIISFVRATEAKCLWLHATDDSKPMYEKFGFVLTSKEMEIVYY
ncbi:MAG: GNAT family N-acetyltransferase [Nostoc sp.]|uniref:GNAT family N-acetyltransferase n=1 Tax=Nostoc sp. TaxID=1180 RepID=UPI002FF6F5D1